MIIAAIASLAIVAIIIIVYRYTTRYRRNRKVFDKYYQNFKNSYEDFYLNDDHYFTFSEKEHFENVVLGMLLHIVHL